MRIVRLEELQPGGRYYFLTKTKGLARFRMVALEIKGDWALLSSAVTATNKISVDNIMCPLKDYGTTWGLKPLFAWGEVEFDYE